MSPYNWDLFLHKFDFACGVQSEFLFCLVSSHFGIYNLPIVTAAMAVMSRMVAFNTLHKTEIFKSVFQNFTLFMQ